MHAKDGEIEPEEGVGRGTGMECGLIWGTRWWLGRGSCPCGATACRAGGARPASVAGRPPTRSSAGIRRAPGGTGIHGSQDTDSRPSWEESQKDSVETASLAARPPDPQPDQPVLQLPLQSALHPSLVGPQAWVTLSWLCPFLLASRQLWPVTSHL